MVSLMKNARLARQKERRGHAKPHVERGSISAPEGFIGTAARPFLQRKSVTILTMTAMEISMSSSYVDVIIAAGTDQSVVKRVSGSAVMPPKIALVAQKKV